MGARWGCVLVAASLAAAAPRQEGALARPAATLPKAEVGTHAGWRGRTMPPLYDLALGAFQRGDAPAAIEFATVLLERDPDSPPALLLLGGAYFRLRRYDDAVYVYERFLRHAPEELLKTRHLAHALHSLGRDAEARAHYLAVLARPAERGGLAGAARANALRGLGLTLRELGELTEARAALLEARALAPLDNEVHLALGRVDEERGDLAAARASAQRARELAPFDPRAAFLLATLALDLGEGEVASAQFRAFERLAPLDVQLRDLELRLLHRPSDRAALLGIGRLQLAQGDAVGAQRTLARLGADSLEGLCLRLDRDAAGAPESARGAAEALLARHALAPEAWDALEAYRRLIGDVAGAAEARARAAALRSRPEGR
ncbi:MAG: tetratricopeptide repeat protein [Planctomycetota bacterium]